MRKRTLVWAGLAVISMALAGCSGQQSGATTGASTQTQAESSAKEEASAAEGGEETGEVSSAYGDYPEKEIELTCPYSAGGGSDVFARTFAEMAQSVGGVPKNIMVVNKPGGSGAVGNSYIYNKKGDDYALCTMVGGQMMTAMVNNSEVQANMLTPIANLALDEFTLSIKTGRFEDLDDFIEKAKDPNNGITVAGSGMASDKQLCMELLNKYLGLSLKYVSFDSGGEVLSAMLGGHVDAGICGPSEIVAQIEAGNVTTLATFSPEPLEGIDAPTFTELGYPECTFQMFRSLAGPPDMPEELVKYWEEVCRKICESDEWQTNYCDANMLTNQFIGSDELLDYWNSELEGYKTVWRDVGLIE